MQKLFKTLPLKCINRILILHEILPYTVRRFRSVQGVTKRCRLSWLTNSALVYAPKRGGGSCGVSTNEHSCTQEPKQTWKI